MSNHPSFQEQNTFSRESAVALAVSLAFAGAIMWEWLISVHGDVQYVFYPELLRTLGPILPPNVQGRCKRHHWPAPVSICLFMARLLALPVCGTMLASYYTGTQCQTLSRAYTVMLGIASANCQCIFAIRCYAVTALYRRRWLAVLFGLSIIGLLCVWIAFGATVHQTQFDIRWPDNYDIGFKCGPPEVITPLGIIAYAGTLILDLVFLGVTIVAFAERVTERVGPSGSPRNSVDVPAWWQFRMRSLSAVTRQFLKDQWIFFLASVVLGIFDITFAAYYTMNANKATLAAIIYPIHSALSLCLGPRTVVSLKRVTQQHLWNQSSDHSSGPRLNSAMPVTSAWATVVSRNDPQPEPWAKRDDALEMFDVGHPHPGQSTEHEMEKDVEASAVESSPSPSTSRKAGMGVMCQTTVEVWPDSHGSRSDMTMPMGPSESSSPCRSGLPYSTKSN